MSNFSWSHRQEDIFDFVENAEGHAVVEAVAGSGKTTTIVEASQRVGMFGEECVLIAFNKHIANELNEKMTGGAMAKTNHAVALSAFRKSTGIGRPKVDGRKYYKIIRDIVDESFPNFSKDQSFQMSKNVRSIFDIARLNLIEMDDIDSLVQLAMHHGITVDEGINFLPDILEKGNQASLNIGHIDFIDMIHVPVTHDMNFHKYDYVFIDECQDLSKLQLEVAIRSTKDDGRRIFVGDSRQAIYGFAGADSESFKNIVNMPNTTQLPLDICYRCPEGHLEMIRDIVPQIKSRDDAPQGIFETVKASDITSLLKPNDLILCRLTAPLVKLCIKIIKEGVPAAVRGREISKSIISEIRTIQKMTGFDMMSFFTFMDLHKRKKLDFFAQKRASQSTIDIFIDKMNCIEVCYESSDPVDINDLCSYIERLFSDERKTIFLSTVHRAKGLENDRVFILSPDLLPMERKNQQAWELVQENNLKYVAHTRSKDSLFYVSDDTRELVDNGIKRV